MEELALRVRIFVYTMICFQCLIQLTAGNSFHKYLKLISQLLALCICCNMFFSFLGIVDDGWEQADKVYEQWQVQWSEEEGFEDMEGYLENHIMEVSTGEFQTQIADLLYTKGKGRYVLKEVGLEEEKWEIVIKPEKVGIKEQEASDFAMGFREAVCEMFSLQKEHVEVKLQ